MVWQVQEAREMDQKPMADVHCSALSSVPPIMSSQLSVWAAVDEKGGCPQIITNVVAFTGRR